MPLSNADLPVRAGCGGRKPAPLARHLFRVVGKGWNFKTAILSASCRGLLFLAATALSRSHHPGRLGAALLETCYAAVAAGIFGSLIQRLRSLRPPWVAGVLVCPVIPLIFQSLELGVHALLGTAVFRAGLIASAGMTCVSALFNLYVMRRGALIVGKEGCSFRSDLLALPRLAVQFLLAAPASAARLWLRRTPTTDVDADATL